MMMANGSNGNGTTGSIPFRYIVWKTGRKIYMYILFICNIKHQKTLKTVFFTCTRNANSLNSILFWMAIAIIPVFWPVSVLYMTLNVFVRDETDAVARGQQMIGFVTATAWMLVTTTRINIISFIGPS